MVDTQNSLYNTLAILNVSKYMCDVFTRFPLRPVGPEGPGWPGEP